MNVFDFEANIVNHYYDRVDIPYPVENNFKKYYFYKSGVLLYSCETMGAYQAYRKENPDVTSEVDFNEVKFLNLRGLYHRKVSNRTKEFRKDLYEYFGVENNPKKEKCFNLAWAHGHSEGYSSVVDYFGELVELIK